MHRGDPPKWVKSKRRKRREREKKKDRKLVITMAKLCMAHASRLGQKNLIFRPFFLLFMASVRSRPPAVPGVFVAFSVDTSFYYSLSHILGALIWPYGQIAIWHYSTGWMSTERAKCSNLIKMRVIHSNVGEAFCLAEQLTNRHLLIIVSRLDHPLKN